MAIIQPLTTWIFSWKNFNSVSSLLHESPWLKMVKTFIFISVPLTLIVLYLVACANNTKATMYGYNYPLDYKTINEMNQHCSDFVKFAYNFGFACNLVTLTVMCGTMVQLKRIEK